MSEPFTSLPLASHRFSSFCEKDGISDLTASLSSYVPALIGDKVRVPSRMGHDKQGLFKINQGELGERGRLGGLFGPLSTRQSLLGELRRADPCGGRKPRGAHYGLQGECQSLHQVFQNKKHPCPVGCKTGLLGCCPLLLSRPPHKVIRL